MYSQCSFDYKDCFKDVVFIYSKERNVAEFSSHTSWIPKQQLLFFRHKRLLKIYEQIRVFGVKETFGQRELLLYTSHRAHSWALGVVVAEFKLPSVGDSERVCPLVLHFSLKYKVFGLQSLGEDQVYDQVYDPVTREKCT